MTLRDILDAIRALPRPDRLRLAEQLNRELVEVSAEEPESLSPHLEPRGRLLVYTGPLAEPALDHRAVREERVDHLSSQVDARRV